MKKDLSYSLTVLLDFFRAKYFAKTISVERTLLDGRSCLLENERLKEWGVYEMFSKMKSTFNGEGAFKKMGPY